MECLVRVSMHPDRAKYKFMEIDIIKGKENTNYQKVLFGSYDVFNYIVSGIYCLQQVI
jgi:hypothetical protein